VYVICVLTKFNSNIDPGSLNIAILPTSLHFFYIKPIFSHPIFFTTTYSFVAYTDQISRTAVVLNLQV